MNAVLKQDIAEFASFFELSDELQSTTFLITGATGLIGSSLIHCLLALEKEINVIAPVRSIEKARTVFDNDELNNIQFIECDIVECNYPADKSIDYIIHCAAPTSSKFFMEYPVQTFHVIYKGSQLLLEYARKHPIKGFIYLSSLEVYGTILDDSIPISEDCCGFIDTMSVRSCYPTAKRAVENLCCLYAEQYAVPTKVARLTQITGAGISETDTRIIAHFCRLAAQGKDIILHTTGEASRPYCYTTDSVSAILYILLKGKVGEAYNVANEETYISARNLAEYLKKNFNPDIGIRIEPDNNSGFAPPTKQRLSTKKLAALGWKPRYDLMRIFTHLTTFLKS